MSLKKRGTSFVMRNLVPIGLLSLITAPFTMLVPAACAQEQIWLRQFGQGDDDEAWALAPDGAGGMMVGGFTWDSLGGPNAGTSDALFARYDSAGRQLWIRQIGTSDDDKVSAMASDAAGGVMIAVNTRGDLGGPNAGGIDTFLARYDCAGNQVWIRQFGTNKHDSAYALASDGMGGVMIGGRTTGTLGGPNAGETDAYIARYDGDGNQLWVRQFGTDTFDQVTGLAPDGAGGAVVAGYTFGDLGGPNAGRIGYDVFVARYDSEGNQLWIRQFGTFRDDSAATISSDGMGGAVVAGRTESSLAGPSAGGTDAFIARYDSAGNQLWIRQFGTSESDGVRGLAPDGAGGVMVAGSTGGSLGGPNSGAAGQDVFIARYDSAGDQLWIRQFGSRSDDRAWAAAADGLGGVAIAGYTEGALGGPFAGTRDIFLARYTIDACYADCDSSTGLINLDIFDFLCFQNSFVNAEPYACDCDASTGPGVCDILDFICYQEAFISGCP